MSCFTFVFTVSEEVDRLLKKGRLRGGRDSRQPAEEKTQKTWLADGNDKGMGLKINRHAFRLCYAITPPASGGAYLHSSITARKPPCDGMVIMVRIA